VSLHDRAVGALASWPAPDGAQDALRREFLACLATGPASVCRAGSPDHLTASALVLDASRTHVLLVLHKKVRLWLQPGGHCEVGDTDLSAAALREAVEETGVPDLQLVGTDPVHLDRHAAPCGERFHLDVRYLLTAADGAATAISDESDDVRWWPVEALPEQSGSDLPELLRAVLGAAPRA
jgi:8-oxo-dGTP pyrophosphatase MutT (NUDIX family)